MHYLVDIPAMIAISYVLGFLFFGFYRQLSARIQKRWGPTIWQSFFDNMKFLFKSETITHGPMFFFGPMIIVAGAITTLLFIPFLEDSRYLQGFSQHGNLILIMYLMVVGPLGNALAVGSSGNPYGVMGVTRGLTRLMGLEVPFFLGLALVMWQHGTVSVHGIMAAQEGLAQWTLVTNPIAFAVVLLPLAGSMNTAPFDVVGAPQEVYSGPRVEFGGRILAALMSQAMILTVAKLVLMVNLFMGGATNLLELLIKAFILFVIIALIGQVFPRLKTEQAVDFFWRVPLGIGILGVIATVWL